MEDVVYEREGDLEIWRDRSAREMLAEWFVPFLQGEAPVQPLKDSHSRKTYRWESPGGVVYVKLFTYAASERWGDWLREIFDWKKRGKEQFEKILFLKEHGINVARPLLALEQRVSFFKHSSLVVMAAVEGDTLTEHLRSADRRAAVGLYERGLGAIEKMHALNIAYGDTKLDNLLVDNDGELFWTDYDDLKTNYRWLPSKLRDLRRYLQSWFKFVRKQRSDYSRAELVEKFYELNDRSMLVKRFVVYRAEKQV